MSNDTLQDRLRGVPSVSRLLAALDGAGVPEATEAVRVVLARAREQVLSGGEAPNVDSLVGEAIGELLRRQKSGLRPAINATGVVLHTGLGRAVLPRRAVENLAAIAGGHSTLEVDVASGARGSRVRTVADLLRDLVGCEDATVVNNNAAAVFLALKTLAAGREVVISRGQLVEIGGQFRIPDVIQASGCRLVEVGATNKTHLRDYEQAIGPDTAVVLHVHPSNFRMVGFTQDVPLVQLADLSRRRKVICMADLGSGALLDLSNFGVSGEPTAQQMIAAGVDVCTWSGDKLLGGPQCGLIVGRAELVGLMKSDPMLRALRVDKLILAALEGTLRCYREGKADREIPTVRAITRPLDDIRAAAERLREALRAGGWQPELVETVSQVGGGSLPGEQLPTIAVALSPAISSIDDIARRLRLGIPAVFGRVYRGQLLLDLRTVARDEEAVLTSAVLSALGDRDHDDAGPTTRGHDSAH